MSACDFVLCVCDMRNLLGDQESSLSHYITAGVAGLEIAQVRLGFMFYLWATVDDAAFFASAHNLTRCHFCRSTWPRSSRPRRSARGIQDCATFIKPLCLFTPMNIVSYLCLSGTCCRSRVVASREVRSCCQIIQADAFDAGLRCLTYFAVHLKTWRPSSGLPTRK